MFYVVIMLNLSIPNIGHWTAGSLYGLQRFSLWFTEVLFMVYRGSLYGLQRFSLWFTEVIFTITGAVCRASLELITEMLTHLYTFSVTSKQFKDVFQSSGSLV